MIHFYFSLINGMFSYPLIFCWVNLIMIILLTDQTISGFTNILSDRLIKFWKRPFTRKRFHSIQPIPTNHQNVTSKPLVPILYLYRKPRQNTLSGGFSGISGLSGSNGLPGYVTLTDTDFNDEEIDEQYQNQNPIVSGINSAVQSLGLTNSPGAQSNKDQQSISISPSSSFSDNQQDYRIPIGSTSNDFLRPLDEIKKQINPFSSFGHGFHSYPFHHGFHSYPFFHHGHGEHSEKGHKIKYIHVPMPYPVIHVKHIKHHDNHHKNDISGWVWALLAAALLPILLGALLLPLALLFALSLTTLLAVLIPGGTGGTFIPITGGTGITTGRRRRSVSYELWDEKKLDETQEFVLDCLRRF